MVPALNKRTPVYPIRTAARMADVHPRRLRAWERQNGLLSPARTDGGHRLFSEEDVERIRQIKALVDRGMSLQGIQRLLAGNGSVVTAGARPPRTKNSKRQGSPTKGP